MKCPYCESKIKKHNMDPMNAFCDVCEESFYHGSGDNGHGDYLGDDEGLRCGCIDYPCCGH